MVRDLEQLNDYERIAELKRKHFHSLLTFTQTFFKLRTGVDFDISEPIGRQSHYIDVIDALEDVFVGKLKNLIINIPPRYGKTEMLIHFIAWALAQYDDSNFIYVSYSHSLAARQTQTIKQIMTMREYSDLFGIKLKDDSQAKDNFQTSNGGIVYAVGAGGAITGFGAGRYGVYRFGGCIVIDDIHKPNEATSDTIREGIIDWFYNTMKSRLNDPSQTPIIYIGQRVHEHDLAAELINKGGWRVLSMPAIDSAGNALCPQKHTVKQLKELQEESPYVFAAQYQQDPQPSGGGIFKPEWFVTHEHEPDITDTFITIDTAETDKTYNDATVFHFFGVYKVKQMDIETDILAIHSLDCLEIRVEPKDLMNEFLNFYRRCLQYKKQPKVVVIERKSTGTTMASHLKQIQGIMTLDVERTKASGSKTERFLSIQPYVAEGRVSLPLYARHTRDVIEHMRKITANDTHRHDDICDTIYDAVKLALIEKFFLKYTTNENKKHVDLYGKYRTVQRLRGHNMGLQLPKVSPFGTNEHDRQTDKKTPF